MTQTQVDNLIEAIQYLRIASEHLDTCRRIGKDDSAKHWTNLAAVYTDSALLDVKLALNALWNTDATK